MDNDLDVEGPIDKLVDDHVRFTMVIIGAPLHRWSPRHLASEAFNANVNEAITLLRQPLVDPVFATTKHLDMRAFKIHNMVL